MLDELQDSRLIFVTGKGGVGKSTVTAGLARALARSGKRTLVLETDTFSAMEDLFDYESTDLEPVAINDNLHASNLTSEECFIATLRRFVPSERIARAVIKNRIARVFFKAAPSVNEVTILDQVREFFEKSDDDGSPYYEHILVDLPASGHAVTFLNVPETMHGMMRGIGPIAKMTRKVADLISDPDTTSIIAVCLPEEMPVNETIELADDLEETLGRPLDMAIANMVHRDPFDNEQSQVFKKLHARIQDEYPGVEGLFFDDQDSRTDSTAIARLVEGNALAVGWARRDREYLDLLYNELQAPVFEVPIVYESSGADIVDYLGNLFVDTPRNDREPTHRSASP